MRVRVLVTFWFSSHRTCAALRRHGTFRRDLNVELCQPMTSAIARRCGARLVRHAGLRARRSWSTVFEQELFADFERQANAAIADLLAKCPSDLTGNFALCSSSAFQICLASWTLTVRCASLNCNDQQLEDFGVPIGHLTNASFAATKRHDRTGRAFQSRR